MLIEDYTVFKLFYFSLLIKSDIKVNSFSSEEIINQDKLLKFMDFMINALESMAALIFGNTVPIYLIIYHWQQLLMIKYCVCMVDYRQTFKILMI